MARLPGTKGTDEIAERIRARRGGTLHPLDEMLLHSPRLADGWNGLLGAIRQRMSLPDAIRELVILRIAVINRADYEWRAHEPYARRAGLGDAQLNALKLAPAGPPADGPDADGPDADGPGAAGSGHGGRGSGHDGSEYRGSEHRGSGDGPSERSARGGSGGGRSAARRMGHLVFDDAQRRVLAYTDALTREVDVSDEVFDALRPHFSDAELVELTATIAAYNMVSRFLVALRIGSVTATETATEAETETETETATETVSP